MSHFHLYLRAMCDDLSSSFLCLRCLSTRWLSEQSFVFDLACFCLCCSSPAGTAERHITNSTSV